MEINTPNFKADMHPGLKGGISIPRMKLGGVGFEIDEVDEVPQIIRNYPPEYPYGANERGLKEM